MGRAAADNARRILRTVVPVLVVGSGVLMIVSARERWWPACRLRNFEAPDCLRLQDHQYDFMAPAQPWVPVGAAAQVGAGALLLLGLALLFLPWLLGGDPRPAVTLPLGALLAAAMLAIAVATGWSGFSGRVFEVPGLVCAYWLWVVTPIALVVTVFCSERTDPSPGIPWRLVVAVLISASAPLGEFFIASALLGSSYDTTPWSEAVSGTFLVAAGLALWPATRSRSSSPIPALSPV